MNKILKNAYVKFWVPVMGRFISKLIPLLEGKAPEKAPTYDIDRDKSKWISGDYSGKEPPWQYPTAREFMSTSFWVLFILFDLRYFVVLSMHDALDDVYLTIGYMYNIPAIKTAE